jgi:transcription initiation factor IIE alpha subunit
MSENIKLNKQVYDKNSYTKIINNSFNKLGESINEKIVNPTLSLNEFFDMYNDLFYDIPELGERNSHEYLIKKSSEYIDFNANQEEIEALQKEIDQLRIDLLEEQKLNNPSKTVE